MNMKWRYSDDRWIVSTTSESPLMFGQLFPEWVWKFWIRINKSFIDTHMDVLEPSVKRLL